MIAVLLLGFGGPDSLEAIEPFLTTLMKGKKPSPEQLKKVAERYKLIGGRSPLLEITKEQARKLEERLNREGKKYKVYIGMRYWYPFISQAVENIAKQGLKHIVALSLSPFSSRVTTSAYLNALEQAISKVGKFEFTFIHKWYTHPLFIDAIVEKIEEKLRTFISEKDEVTFLFSAHSLPKEYVVAGDPYVAEIREVIELIMMKFGNIPWQLGYQSKGEGRGEWLGPDVEDLLWKAAQQGWRKVLLVPIGFVADHIETLYDIDIALRKKAEEFNLLFQRVSCLNASPKFIEALASIVEERIRAEG